VQAFEALFESVGRDFPRFYTAVQVLAGLPLAERRQRLADVAGPSAPDSPP
jgi:predicted aminopeptidase